MVRCDGQYAEEAFGSGSSRREGRTRFFATISFKSENKYFSPEPIYSNSNAMFFVEEKGNKFQVKKKKLKKTYFFLKIYKTIVAGEQDGLLRGGGRPVL